MYATLEYLSAIYRWQRRRSARRQQQATFAMEATLDHVAFNVRDPMRLINFYTEVLQLAPEKVAEYQEGKAYFPSVRLNASTILDFIPAFRPKSSCSLGAHLHVHY